MSRRKKLNGYNPKQEARDAIIRQMRAINSTEHLFIHESRLMADNLDAEMASLAAIADPDLRTYLQGRMEIVKKGYAGLLQEFLQKIADVRTPADKVATAMMDRLANEKWDAVRDVFTLTEIQLGAAETEAVVLGQSAMGAGIDLFTDYASRRAAVDRGIKANASTQDILAQMTALDKELAEKQTAAEDASVSEEPNNV